MRPAMLCLVQTTLFTISDTVRFQGLPIETNLFNDDDDDAKLPCLIASNPRLPHLNRIVSIPTLASNL